MLLTAEEFSLFRNLIYDEAGICFKDTRKDFLENRVYRRMGATGLRSPYQYYRFITNGGRAEFMNLLDILTVNETSFFRNRPQLELFRTTILNDVIRRKEKDIRKKIRIWSAVITSYSIHYTKLYEISTMLPIRRNTPISVTTRRPWLQCEDMPACRLCSAVQDSRSCPGPSCRNSALTSALPARENGHFRSC